MNRSAKTVSVRQLQTAVQAALEATRKIHPDAKVDFSLTTDSWSFVYRPWLICGIPIPWPEYELNQAVEFATTFTNNLAKSPAVAPLAVDGQFQPAVYVAGKNVSLGFVPGDAPISE
ncbi:MAG: hypothetical protein ABSF70_20315 [Terracidiphilus sp.]|jgi:hypothetical protein